MQLKLKIKAPCCGKRVPQSGLYVNGTALEKCSDCRQADKIQAKLNAKKDPEK